MVFDCHQLIARTVANSRFIAVLTILSLSIASEALAHKLILSESGYSDINLGSPKALVIDQFSSHVDDSEIYDKPFYCHYLSPKAYGIAPHFMIVEGVVARIDIDDDTYHVRTKENIGVGSTLDQLLAAYSEISISNHPYLGSAGKYAKV